MTKLEQLADLRKKRMKTYHNELKQIRRMINGDEVEVYPTFWEQVRLDYEEQIKTLKRKIGPGDY